MGAISGVCGTRNGLDGYCYSSPADFDNLTDKVYNIFNNRYEDKRKNSTNICNAIYVYFIFDYGCYNDACYLEENK